MKNLKKISRENLKSVKGGLRYCDDQQRCGVKSCCANGVCRPLDSVYCQIEP
ncbi:bacteriocin-like protein [Chryseobacterium angstadtii]|uniref:bacteriocin-like protein n=1 Tax=Chryseobacterium angstadtii TaxID=558151 RepID=UPI000A8BDA22|nr:hypothetical protein [Chryseobacterium angstadtii]